MRRIKQQFVQCRRYDAQPCAEVTAPLPEGRVAFNRPFGFCGIDHAGPLLAKAQQNPCKVWLALFVCGATRAVHIEVVTSLALEDFLLAFRRFVARRGQPHQIVSDNAATFKAVATTLSVKWFFNPPVSPWWGGFFEWLVKTIKIPFKKVLGCALPHLNELITIIMEVESLVNSRPLTHVSFVMDEAPVIPAMLSWGTSGKRTTNLFSWLNWTKNT